MAIHTFGLSPEITQGKILQTNSHTPTEEIAKKLSNGKYYITSPEQAFDIISNALPTLKADGDIEFYLGVLYVIGEYLNGNDSYNENNTEGYYHIQNAVNSARNRKGIISSQVSQILGKVEQKVTVTDIDFKGLSNSITDFVVNTNSSEKRRKMQSIKNVLLKKLGLNEQADWTAILNKIESITLKDSEQKEAA